jgi:hypothetical protein
MKTYPTFLSTQTTAAWRPSASIVTPTGCRVQDLVPVYRHNDDTIPLRVVTQISRYQQHTALSTPGMYLAVAESPARREITISDDGDREIPRL